MLTFHTMKLVVVIPAYNEATILSESIKRLRDFMITEFEAYDWQIVIADNASTDKTSEMTQEWHKKDHRVVSYYLEQKGKGRAIRGAWLKFPADIACFMDADLATNLSALSLCVNAIVNGNDMAIGSRSHQNSIVVRGRGRKIVSWINQFLLQFLTGTRLHDTPCGFKVVNRHVVNEIMPCVKNETWFFDSELVIRAEAAGLKIKEIPVQWSDVRDSVRQSGVHFWHVAWEYLREGLQLRKELQNNLPPLHLPIENGKIPGWMIFLLSLILIFFTNLPYLYGYFTTPPGYAFTGVIQNGDTNTYFSRIEQIKQGSIFLTDLYTSEPQPLIWLDPFWLFVGMIARVFNLSPVFTFHFLRVLLTPVLVIVVSCFLRDFVLDKTRRVLCFLIIFFTSGMGWLMYALPRMKIAEVGFYSSPIDLWVPEAFPYFSILVSPHFITTTILLVFIFHRFFRGLIHGHWKSLISSALAALFLFWFHPFKVPVVYGVLGCFTVIVAWQTNQWKQHLSRFMVFLFISSPSVIYIYWLLSHHMVLRFSNLQNLNLTPSWYYVLIGYGLIGILALIGIYQYKKRNFEHRFENIFLLTWFVFGAYLIYSPFHVQRRFIEGWFIPMSIFASLPLNALIQYLLKRKLRIWRHAVFSMLCVFLITSNIIITASYMSQYKNFPQDPYRLSYIKKDYFDAYDWIKNNSSIHEYIFSAPYHGNFIPATAGRGVFIGHRPMTIFYHEKFAFLRRFFADDDMDVVKEKFLRENRFRYLLYSEFERSLGTFDPKQKNFLRLVYQNNSATIYEVR